MPIKNKARPTNSGLAGKITGLDEDEMKVLNNAGIGGGYLTLDLSEIQPSSLTSLTYSTIEGIHDLLQSNTKPLVIKFPDPIVYPTSGTEISCNEMLVRIYDRTDRELSVVSKTGIAVVEQLLTLAGRLSFMMLVGNDDTLVYIIAED